MPRRATSRVTGAQLASLLRQVASILETFPDDDLSAVVDRVSEAVQLVESATQRTSRNTHVSNDRWDREWVDSLCRRPLLEARQQIKDKCWSIEDLRLLSHQMGVQVSPRQKYDAMLNTILKSLEAQNMDVMIRQRSVSIGRPQMATHSSRPDDGDDGDRKERI